MLRKLETFTLFAAMMLAIVLEAGCVYWLWTHGELMPVGSGSANLIGDATNLVAPWTSTTLPQCWLLGALLVLFYRLGRMVVPPDSWDRATLLDHRRAFLRLWRWFMALAAVHGLALYVGGYGTLP